MAFNQQNYQVLLQNGMDQALAYILADSASATNPFSTTNVVLEPVVTATTTATLSPNTCLLANATTATFTVTLAAGINGQKYRMKSTGTTNNITVAVPAGASLDGTLNGTFALTPGTAKMFITDGTNFYGI